MGTKKLIILFSSTMLISNVIAQDTAKTLNEVVITATKFPVKQTETGKVITVITQEQLQKNCGKSLPEVLNRQVGITINGANNTSGTNQSVFIRGASSSNALILLDGVPLYDASGESNVFDINNFALNNIERIEILKGSQSTLYGSDAVAGVINIISKKTFNKPVNFNLNLSAGSYHTYKGSASLSGSNGKGQTYFVSYSNLNSKGFSSAYDSAGNNNFDKDGFKQNVLQLNYGFKPVTKLEIRTYGKYNINLADIDAGAFADDKDYRYKYRNLIAGTAFQYQLKTGLIKFNYNYNWFDREFTDDSTSVGGFATYQKGNYTGKSHFAELFSNLQLGHALELLAGVDYRRNATDQSYSSISFFGPYVSPSLSADTTKTNQLSGYASLIVKNIQDFNIELGGRWNNHSLYGNNFTYSFNPYYLLHKKYKWFANISSGYKVPSLYQLYGEFGNRNLQPEVSTGFEGGLQYISDKINGRVVVFKRNIKNVFYFYTDPITFQSLYVNEDRQKDWGIETELALQISNELSLNTNYTFVDGKIYTLNLAAKDTSYNNLYKRPAHTFNFSIGYQPVQKLYISAHLKGVSKFYEAQYAAADFLLKGYYTLNFYSEFQFNKKGKIFVDLQNITDQKYFDQKGFTTKRFNFNAGLNVNL